mgnify:CR=1 FL=1
MALRLLPAQLDEIWAADEPTAVGILARIASQPKHESDLRQSIYVDFLHQTLAFCKDVGFSVAKTFVAFETIVAVHAQACGGCFGRAGLPLMRHLSSSRPRRPAEPSPLPPHTPPHQSIAPMHRSCTCAAAPSARAGQLLSKEEAFAQWSQLLMERISALPPEESMTLAQVQSLTAHVSADYFNHYELHQHVFTQEREGERRRLNAFVQLAALPLPLEQGTPVVHAPASDAEAAPSTDAVRAATPAADAAAPAAPDELPDAGLPEVDEAIAKLVEDRVEAARAALAAQFDQREAELAERIASLELAAEKSSRPASRAGSKKK